VTDLKTWTHDNLAKLAQELKDENDQLRQQVKDLLKALRAEWVNTQKKD
jgi:hypothetical protein